MIYGTPTSYCVSRCVWFFFLLHFASLNVPKKNHWWLNDNRIIVNKQTNKQNYYTKQIYVRYYCCCPKIFLSWFLLVFCYFHPLNKHIGWIFLFLSVSNNWCFFFYFADHHSDEQFKWFIGFQLFPIWFSCCCSSCWFFKSMSKNGLNDFLIILN